MILSTHDIISLILSIVGFGAFANMAINRARGNRVSIAATVFPIGMILFTFLYRLIFHNVGFLDTLFLTIRDVGIGLMTSAFWAILRRGSWKLYLVNGLICLSLYAGYYLITKVFSWVKGEIQELKFNSDAQKEILLELGIDDDISELEPIFKKFGATYEQAFPFITKDEDEDLAMFYIVRSNSEVKEALLSQLLSDTENVDSAEPNVEQALIPNLKPVVDISRPVKGPNDPKLSEQWGLENAHFVELFNTLKNKKPKKKARIAIVDTGVDSNHEDIIDVFSSSPGNTDVQGHGTHCAGIAGAVTDNGKGIASTNWKGNIIEILGFKALNDDGTGSIESVTKAILQAAESDVDVISLSLGGYHPVPPKAEVLAINFAKKKGITVVVAAGNSNEDAKLHSPSNVPGVIVVAATDIDDNKAKFSNTNISLGQPISAPGVDILSAKAGSKNGYVSFSGTSMATPMVAGLVGLMRAYNPKLTPDEIYKILHETGSETSSSGIGRLINAEKALSKAKAIL